MNSRTVFIIVMGVVALTALVSIAIESHWGSNVAINGTVAIAGAAVGALATLAGGNGKPMNDTNYIEVNPSPPGFSQPPRHGWPEQTTKETELG
jgi:hypothetical protein